MTDEYLFISDCHLDPSRPDISDNLTEFLSNRASSARCLYVLGDLFETWIGDDDPAVHHADIFRGFQTLSQQTELFFVAGNRDFLLGQKAAKKLGATIITEPCSITLGEQKVVLMHGDSLCIDDTQYQAFRTLVRNEAWQHDFLNKPLDERKNIAAGLREQSKASMQQKSMAIVDVNQQAVMQSFKNLDTNTIIHGHTHKPAIHHYAGNKRRYVLGDWDPQPSYLSWRADTGLVLTDPRV